MKKIFLLAVCAVCAIGMSAQRASSTSSSFFSTEKSDEGIKFGLRAGLNFSNIKYDGGSTDSRTGFQVGAIVDFPIIESLHIQPGLFLVQKGGKEKYVDYEYDDETYETKMNPLYVEIPVLASFRFNIDETWQIQANVGPYFALGVSGDLKDDDEKTDFFGDGVRRFDWGLQFGVGVNIAKHYYVGTSYDLGLCNYAKNGTLKNRSWYISLGYNF